MSKMVAEEGSLEGLTFELSDQNEWTIGRDPERSNLIVEDPSVSKEHAHIEKKEDGYYLSNLSLTSLTLVNGEQIKEPVLLQDGDQVIIGAQPFRFLNNTEDAPDTANKAESSEETPEEASPQEEASEEHFQNEPFELKPTDDPENAAVKNLSQEEAHEDLSHEEPEERYDSLFEDEPVSGKLASINFDLVESGRFLLKVISGPNNGAEFAMQTGKSYIIGNDPNSCDIVFHDTSVSKQHARIQISEDDVLSIEDLNSRNGVAVDGKKIGEKTPLQTNSVVHIGTTSFVIYDREGNMNTIISPLLPQIVKVLQRDEEEEASQEKGEPIPLAAAPPPPKEKPMGAFILIAMITGLFVLAAIGTTTLFKSTPVEETQAANADTELSKALSPFPSVKYSFNKSTGRLFLVGHVMTQTDRNQLLYNLQGKNFIKSIDDAGIVVDELVWQNTNLVLNKNPAWRGISLQSEKPGNFVLTGYLQNRKQAEQLYDYITANFPYLDHIDRQVVIEEDVVQQVTNALQSNDIRSVNVQFANGEIILTGGIPAQKQDAYTELMGEFREIPGVRQVRSQVANLVADQSTINISDRYEVSGYSKAGRIINVVINGRIVTRGDTLDGMLIKSISPTAILLEKDLVNYRIDYSR